MMPRLRHAALLVVLAAALAVLVAACPAHTPPPSPNTVVLPVPDDPTITFMIWLRVGSQNDPPGKEGLAALTGAMLAEGSTTKNPYPTILEELYPLASSYRVRVDKEMTSLAGRSHRDNLETFFELFTDAYLHPAFDASDFERLRKDHLNALTTNLRYAQDEELGKAAFTAQVFAGTPYAHPTIGTVQGLQAIALDDVRAFYAAYYTRENVRVALGGGYDDALVGRFEATLSGLPTGKPTALPAITPAGAEGRRVVLVDKPGADASISFGFPISVHRGEDDFYALWLANSWLGEHRNSSSHLYQVIRSARGMNYGDYSYIEAFPNGGRRQMPPTNVAREHQVFEVWIRTLPNEQALFALRAALREVQHLIDQGLSEEEFELTRSFLQKYRLHYAETTQERLGYAVDDRFYTIGGEGHLARFGERLSTLTREEVNAAIKKYLALDDVTIAIVTGEAESLREALLADAPSPITYSTPKPPEVTAEDQEIAAYPLAVTDVAMVPVAEIFER